ncbi:MAG: hypothetical protein M3T55_01375 [Pseudomonadota bacterium]|nr:hypothetical protein [Pseudomonadota bacterium]
MARDLDSELARLARIVRRRVAFLEPREIASANPIRLSVTERIALIWDRGRARVLRWLRGEKR